MFGLKNIFANYLTLCKSGVPLSHRQIFKKRKKELVGLPSWEKDECKNLNRVCPCNQIPGKHTLPAHLSTLMKKEKQLVYDNKEYSERNKSLQTKRCPTPDNDITMKKNKMPIWTFLCGSSPSIIMMRWFKIAFFYSPIKPGIST